MSSTSRNHRAITLLELLVVIAIMGILMGLLLSAVQRVREVAARAKCANNLHQLSIALHLHHDTHERLPPGHRSLRNPDRMPFSGWTLSILPFLEQSALADQAAVAYLTTPNPFKPPHAGLSIVVGTFTCPSDGRVSIAQTGKRSGTRAALTSYLGVAGRDAVTARDGLLFQDSTSRFADVRDGLSNTLLLGERPPSADFQFGWWYAGIGQRLTGSADLVLGVREQNLQPISVGSPCGPGSYPYMPASGESDPCGMFHFWSPHPGGANFVLADGSVRFVGYTADPLMPALASRAGNEAATLPD